MPHEVGGRIEQGPPAGFGRYVHERPAERRGVGGHGPSVRCGDQAETAASWSSGIDDVSACLHLAIFHAALFGTEGMMVHEIIDEVGAHAEIPRRVIEMAETG